MVRKWMLIFKTNFRQNTKFFKTDHLPHQHESFPLGHFQVTSIGHFLLKHRKQVTLHYSQKVSFYMSKDADGAELNKLEWRFRQTLVQNFENFLKNVSLFSMSFFDHPQQTLHHRYKQHSKAKQKTTSKKTVFGMVIFNLETQLGNTIINLETSIPTLNMMRCFQIMFRS